MVPMLLAALVVVARSQHSEHSCLLQKTTPGGASLLAQQVASVPGWTAAGQGSCAVTLATKSNEPIFAQCGQFCDGVNGANAFAVGFFGVVSLAPDCRCCDGLDGGTATTYTRDAGAVVIGDPHITTLDGVHYTLLSQGSFSLWHFHGLETEIAVAEHGAVKKMPVDWEIYTHYSGRQSLTKGLLLVDRSGGMARQVLELTSKDCQWRAKIGTADWSMVSKPQFISVPDETGSYVSGFNLTNNRVSGGHGHHINQVRLNMITKDGISDIAVLGLICMPQRSLNLHLVMKRKGDTRFVDGELSARKSVMLSSLQTSSTSLDAEFAIRGRWQDIGGSDQAAAYFRLIDEDKAVAKSSLLQTCNSMAEKDQAKSTCAKYLEPFRHLDRTGSVFNDCVDDVCHGAGEVAAEMAGELLASLGADGI